MQSVSDVIEELIGNGHTEEEVLDISMDLTQFVISRAKLQERLANSFDEEELKEILMLTNPASIEQQVMSHALKSLSRREKQCFLMHTLHSKSMGVIATEIGVSKGSVAFYINRAREKIKKATGQG